MKNWKHRKNLLDELPSCFICLKVKFTVIFCWKPLWFSDLLRWFHDSQESTIIPFFTDPYCFFLLLDIFSYNQKGQRWTTYNPMFCSYLATGIFSDFCKAVASINANWINCGVTGCCQVTSVSASYITYYTSWIEVAEERGNFRSYWTDRFFTVIINIVNVGAFQCSRSSICLVICCRIIIVIFCILITTVCGNTSRWSWH